MEGRNYNRSYPKQDPIELKLDLDIFDAYDEDNEEEISRSLL